MDRQGFRRVDVTDTPPWTADLADCEADPRPDRAPSSVVSLLIKSMFLPDEIVRIVEGTVGWLDLNFGIREGDQVLQMSPGNFRPLRRVVQALRDIAGKTLTSEVKYVMQNLQEYKTLLGRLLDELKLCREMQSPRGAQPPLNLPTRNPNDLPEPNPNDLTHHAGALEVLLNELDAQDHVVILLAQFDPHIFTVQQLIEFLS